ncbi:hypothetical protein BB561_004286 [Smittium simulii]|uniref:Uncharacterized protein n=1 Tax=Smittium simulii TaxID=133385 RepID=A0A2T9YH40_9FUNG|nr:hypothetical protein BB561_004286 [Smittium simulii]
MQKVPDNIAKILGKKNSKSAYYLTFEGKTKKIEISDNELEVLKKHKTAKKLFLPYNQLLLAGKADCQSLSKAEGLQQKKMGYTRRRRSERDQREKELHSRNNTQNKILLVTVF